MTYTSGTHVDPATKGNGEMQHLGEMRTACLRVRHYLEPGAPLLIELAIFGDGEDGEGSADPRVVQIDEETRH